MDERTTAREYTSPNNHRLGSREGSQAYLYYLYLLYIIYNCIGYYGYVVGLGREAAGAFRLALRLLWVLSLRH